MSMKADGAARWERELGCAPYDMVHTEVCAPVLDSVPAASDAGLTQHQHQHQQSQHYTRKEYMPSSETKARSPHTIHNPPGGF